MRELEINHLHSFYVKKINLLFERSVYMLETNIVSPYLICKMSGSS